MPERKKRLISYRRWSTEAQSDGTSQLRQMFGLKKYAAKAGYVVDEKLSHEDAAVSGWTGANRSKGAMGRLLEDIKIGVIRAGDAIWVDAWDLASRESPYDSINTIRNDILSKGVSIITADDNRFILMKSSKMILICLKKWQKA